MAIDENHKPYLLEWSKEHDDICSSLDNTSNRLVEFAINILLDMYHGILLLTQEEVDSYFMDTCGAIDLFQVLVYNEETIEYYNLCSEIINNDNAVMLLYEVDYNYSVSSLFYQLIQDEKDGKSFLTIKRQGTMIGFNFDD